MSSTLVSSSPVSSSLVFLQAAEGEFSIVRIFLDAGPVAMLVFAILAVMSIASWSVMVAKYNHFRRLRNHSRSFLQVFRRSARFSEINSASEHYDASPLVGLFQSGYVEIDAQVKAGRDRAGGHSSDGRYRILSMRAVERSLERAKTVELHSLARHTSILATTAAAAPFIGLFGTVWGIMIAFNEIGATGSASIVTVAPGIAEALVNTAAGLVAAIPALVGYNQIGSRVRQIRAEMDDFVLEFLNLTERNFT